MGRSTRERLEAVLKVKGRTLQELESNPFDPSAQEKLGGSGDSLADGAETNAAPEDQIGELEPVLVGTCGVE